ncbi:hypothetical protein CJF32_00004575 [Rutstroemia sp. NJR-2017a WRK4]|nr:hypothetical protein CJF32_00004575 [Rutstroemia sp. NJR-2017a WRK4]
MRLYARSIALSQSMRSYPMAGRELSGLGRRGRRVWL